MAARKLRHRRTNGVSDAQVRVDRHDRAEDAADTRRLSWSAWVSSFSCSCRWPANSGTRWPTSTTSAPSETGAVRGDASWLASYHAELLELVMTANKETATDKIAKEAELNFERGMAEVSGKFSRVLFAHADFTKDGDIESHQGHAGVLPSSSPRPCLVWHRRRSRHCCRVRHQCRRGLRQADEAVVGARRCQRGENAADLRTSPKGYRPRQTAVHRHCGGHRSCHLLRSKHGPCRSISGPIEFIGQGDEEPGEPRSDSRHRRTQAR